MGLTLEEINELRRIRDAARGNSAALPVAVPPAVAVDNDGSRASGSTEMLELLIRDIRKFVAEQTELMFNEGDFQLQLAVALRASGHYDDVQVECYIPNSLAVEVGYDWDSNLYLDIVVRCGDEYCPVELKYPTRRVVRDINRFGRELERVEIMRNQGAQDIVRYNFWKDVRRCEIIKALFPKVNCGLAVMLTNDPSYTRQVRASSACLPFSTGEGVSAGPGVMDWQGTPTVGKTHTKFHLSSSYRIAWTPYVIDSEQFYLTIVKI